MVFSGASVINSKVSSWKIMIGDLVTKYLLKESTAEENRIVIKWINESEINKKLFDQFHAIIEVTNTFNAEKAFQKFKDNLGNEV